MTELEINRHNALIDPHLAVWGWEIPVYLFLGGLAAGIMILAALAARRPAAERALVARLTPFAAPVVLSLGMLALFLDLHARLHVFRFYTALRLTAPMSWGAWILLAIYPAAILLGLAGLTAAELDRALAWRPVAALRLGGLARGAHAFAARHGAGLRVTNVALGAALGVYTGILLSNLGARAAWSSALLGPLFLVSGVSAGAAFLMLFPLSHDEHRLLRRWDLAAIGLEVALLLLYLFALATSAGAGGQQAAALFLGGRFTAPFWSLVVIAGLAVPLVLELVEARRGLKPTLVAPALVLAGGLALRVIVVLAGQA
ncbi:MAG TPA: NrfD/PsrC family molybdoenzyme membrane anchor subunit [Polyangia bacterium]|jgi:formate-dependent nitrite reductase membrane component NrfD